MEISRRQLVALAIVLIYSSACGTARLLAPEGTSKEVGRHHGTASRSLSVADTLSVEAAPETMQDLFDAAISCRAVPTAATSKPDTVGRLFGWRDNQTCAFKDVAGHALFYTGYVPASWLHTPPCKAAPFPDDSVADSQFKVWGWQQSEKGDANNAKSTAGALELCAYKSDQQQPTPIDRRVYRLTWLDAPACVEEPEPSLDNSMSDNKGCLWGWQLERNCAFKRHTDEPMYYDGYNGTCNTTVDLAPVGSLADNGFDFGAAEGQDGSIGPLSVDQVVGDAGNDSPGAVTSVGPIRQKAPEKDLTASQVDNLVNGKSKGPNLNSTIVASSDDNQGLEGTGPVSDTPVPIVFDNDTSSQAVASPSFSVVNPQVVEEANAPTRRLHYSSLHRVANRL